MSRSWCFGLCGLTLSLVGVLAAKASPESDLMEQERESLKAVCAKCHNLQIVTSTRLSYDGWHETVQKMLDRGAVGTDEQLNDVMDYLHRTMTTIDVNSADSGELGLVLGASDTTIAAIVARRALRKFENLKDLKTIPGIDTAALDKKATLLYFQ
jgi:hypothetical protein